MFLGDDYYLFAYLSNLVSSKEIFLTERVVLLPKKGINIFKRKDGRWEARYLKGVDANGRKKYGSVYGKTFEEAKQKQTEYSKKNNQESDSYCIHLELREVTDTWISNIKKNVKQSTYQKYESIIRNHIKPHPISKMKIDMLNTRTINDFSLNLLNANNLSKKTVNDILVVLGLVLKYAEEMYGITKPKIKYHKVSFKEMRILSIEEQTILEGFLYDETNYYKLGVLIALYTGIRLGELCALQWSDIYADRITINKTAQRLNNNNRTTLEITLPKTPKSIRNIPIPSFLIPILEKNRETGYVLKNRKGNMVEPRLMQMTFEKYISQCGLSKVNFHALRHTFATRCIEAGFDIKSLSDILGHSDVKTTLNRYVHSSMKQKQKNMNLLHPLSTI